MTSGARRLLLLIAICVAGGLALLAVAVRDEGPSPPGPLPVDAPPDPRPADLPDRAGTPAPETPADAPAAAPAFDLRGVVRDEQGRPIAGATVGVVGIPNFARVATTTTDGEGRFRFEGIREAVVYLYADAGGLISTHHILSPDRQVEEEEIPLVVHRAVEVTGRLVDEESGDPVAGAVLRPRMGSLPIPRPETRADADGRFSILALPGQSLFAAIRAPGYLKDGGNTIVESVPPAGGPVGEVTVPTVPPTQTVVGRVLDPDGSPVHGALVTAHLDAEPSLTARTDTEGRFRLEGLSHDHGLSVRAEGYPEVTDVSQFEMLLCPDLHLRAWASVSGRVLAAERPAPGVEVTFRDRKEWPRCGPVFEGRTSWTAVTDADGRYSVPALPAATYWIRAFPSGRDVVLDEEVEIRPGEDNVKDLQLGPARTIRGRILAGGAPAGGASVRACLRVGQDDFGSSAYRDYPGEVAEDGTFVIEGAPTREVHLAADAPGYLRGYETPGPGDGAVVTIHLEPAMEVAGVVRGADGLPAWSLPVRLVAAGRDPRSVTTDDEGRFRFREIPPGSYEIEVRVQGQRPWTWGPVAAGDTKVLIVLPGPEPLPSDADRRQSGDGPR